MDHPHPDQESGRRDDSKNSSDAGVLALIQLCESPFQGEIFSTDALKSGLWLLESGAVRVVTANVQGSFAGIFGQISIEGESNPAEISMVINLDQAGQWKVDGRSDFEKPSTNGSHVAALLMAAMVEKGAVEAGCDFGMGSVATRICLFTKDVRAGILHWDDSDARAVLENMHLARVENVDPKMQWLQ